MNRNAFIMLSLWTALGCQNSVKGPVVGPDQGAAPAKPARIVFEVPFGQDFPIEDGDARTYLEAYKFKLSASSKDCADSQRYELHDFRGNEWIRLNVDPRCSYRLRFAIGRERPGSTSSDPDFEAYYHTEEPITVESEELSDEGEVEVSLRLARTAAGEKAGFTEEWVRVGQGGGNWGSFGQSPGGEDPGGSDPGSDPGAGLVSYADVKPIIDQKCAAGCHQPGGSFAGIPLTNFAEVSAYKDRVIARSEAGTMPPVNDSRKLTPDELDKLKKWAAGGFQEGRSASGDAPGGGQQDLNRVRFEIPQELINGAWNGPNQPVEVKVGGELTVVNNTDKDYWIHTDGGAPFPHPGGYIRAGQQATYIIRRPFEGAVRQHDGTQNRFQFYIRAIR